MNKNDLEKIIYKFYFFSFVYNKFFIITSIFFFIKYYLINLSKRPIDRK